MKELWVGIMSNFTFLHDAIVWILFLWFLAVAFTAIAVRAGGKGRGPLWGAGISLLGAVIILLCLELAGGALEIKEILSSFITMSLGGLGSGLLAVALIEDTNETQALRFRDGLFSVLDYAFVWIGLSSLSMLFFFLLSKLSGQFIATNYVLEVMAVIFSGAFLSLVVLERRDKLGRLGEGVGLVLFLFLVALSILYGKTLDYVWAQAWAWILVVNGLLVLAMGGVWWYYRKPNIKPLFQP
ncbi:hypothetical protein [Pseudomonas sp. D2002]|uniref:hypothetical protein n=1 Tax=Pseudomonas sp. D2002 TaxID=2726980 RepID=UPI0015A01AFB|nr:hypothetical protein [Pseudomonas sp. D2002]NWA84794.1 hypothetical protein [Pseudomonas sp. D2002]